MEKVNLKAKYASIGFESDHDSLQTARKLWAEKFKDCQHPSTQHTDSSSALKCLVCGAHKSGNFTGWGNPVAPNNIPMLERELNVVFSYPV